MIAKLGRNNGNLKILAPKDNTTEYFTGSAPAESRISVRGLNYLFPPVHDCCEITIRCRASDFSASRIARAVEDADAHLINLNVVNEPESALTTVALRVTLANPSAAIAALERYGYSIVAVDAPNTTADPVLASRIEELLHNINI